MFRDHLEDALNVTTLAKQHNLDEPPIHDRSHAQSVSKLAPFAGLILIVCTLCIYLVDKYLFEPLLLPRIYPETWKRLEIRDEKTMQQRRSFVNHHIAGAIKILMIVTTIYPLLVVTFGSATLHSPIVKGSVVTMGDWFLVSMQLFCAMYIFDLVYCCPIKSYVSVAHHMGTVLIGQAALVLNLDPAHADDATPEFFLCLWWGAFDILAETWPHISIILYRVYPKNHVFLIKVFRAAVIVSAIGTIVETCVLMWLFGSLWKHWTLAFKVLTPVLHCVFTAAQFWGTYKLYELMKWQKREASKAVGQDVEQSEMSSDSEETAKERDGHANVAGTPSQESEKTKDQDLELSEMSSGSQETSNGRDGHANGAGTPSRETVY